jgi:TolB-like protein/DNA-binding winged helix-turn-helix (wHTH) protein/Flp pilus assembly protein TadD
MTNDAAQAMAPAESPRPSALCIGDWQVIGDLNQIVRGEQTVHLEPKSMAVLLHLADHSGQVVGRDALMASAWPGVVVGDNALNQVVIKLRRALGDSARNPIYLQAVAKKGYRLIASVRRGESPGGLHPAVLPKPAPQSTGRRPATRPVVLVLGALLVALAWLWAPRPAPQGSPSLPESSVYGMAHPSITPAVLVETFEVVGTSPGQVPLSQAIAADLVSDLSKVSGLQVVAATRAIARAETQEFAPPRYRLSGTVQEEGDHLRLNLSLADAETGRQLWSERFDRQLADMFELQDELVARVLEVLPVKVTEAETLRVAWRSTRNLRAYQTFVQAQSAMLVRRAGQSDAARTLYWEAIALDPAFARAYAGLAMTYAFAYQLGWKTDDANALERATEFAETARRMRPDMPEAHWVLAFVSTQRRRHAEAQQHLDDALRLNASYADAYALRAGVLTYIGRPRQSVEQLQMALRLNPDAGSLYFLVLGRAYFFLGDNEQAAFALNRALDRNPENLEARIYLAAILWLAGDRDAGLWQINEIRSLEPEFDAVAWLDSYPMTDVDERERLRTVMSKMGL